MAALGSRLVRKTAGLFAGRMQRCANRALDPVLPRLCSAIQTRLAGSLDVTRSPIPEARSLVPRLARLLRAIGVPVLNLLEARLYEARRQLRNCGDQTARSGGPERLLRGLARAMASWEWNLQDLA